MKKIAVILTSIIAALSFSSCSKELTSEVEAPATAQKIYLNLGSATRTSYDGTSTTWSDGDAISVFLCEHGTAETATWTNYKFTCEDAAAGTFSAEIDGLSSTASYDMYAFYPYYSGWSKPDSTSFNIAYNQKLSGIDGTTGGSAQPLWGAQTSGQKISSLSMSMHQIATYFKFAITATDDITISSITMTAPSGTYLGTSIVLDALDGGAVTDGKYKQNSITTTINNGTIASGKTGIFTVLTRPFALTSGQELECEIATSDGKKMTFTVTAPASGYDFTAGKVNTVARTFTVDAAVTKTLPYSESFANSFGDFTVKNISLASALTYAWTTNSSYAKASAYMSNTNYDAESWLVSPTIDLTSETSASLTFSYAIRYGAVPYSDNFYLVVIDEDDEETAIAIDGLPTELPSSWTFNNATVDLSAYCGSKIKLAFVYKSTSSNSDAPTVELKDMTISSGSSSSDMDSYSTYSWDLSTDCTASASTTAMSWTSSYATMDIAKANAQTNSNNYYPGTSGKSYTSTRFYKNSVLTITPSNSCEVAYIVFVATSASYASALASSTWTNATASVSGSTVTVTATDKSSAIEATIGATCGFTSVTIYYK